MSADASFGVYNRRGGTGGIKAVPVLLTVLRHSMSLQHCADVCAPLRHDVIEALRGGCSMMTGPP